MTTNDDNPHYDDLIRELGELKKFIESNGENVVAPAARPDEDPPKPLKTGPGPVDEGNAVPDHPPEQTPAATAHDDEPPTLREAVRRPPGRDEMQLDLLSLGGGNDPREPHDSEAAHDMPAAEDTPVVAPIASAPVTGDVNDVRDAQPSDPAVDRAGEAPPHDPQPGSERDDDEAPDDDEVVQFVLDLSDRILNSIEDKLLEHSGELLPADVRGELREAVGDILYQWCER